MNVVGTIADHPTPKFGGGEIAYTMNSRDYKAVMAVVISKNYRVTDGKQPSGELLRTGCICGYVGDGEWKQ